MYFPYFHSFITFFILAISRSNFAQIQWSWTFFNSQDDELFKNVQDFWIWVKFDRVIVKKTLIVFLFVHPLTTTSQTKLRYILCMFPIYLKNLRYISGNIPHIFHANFATLGHNLGFSAMLKIWQLPACKMEPQSGIISCNIPTHSPSKFWKAWISAFAYLIFNGVI